MFLNMSLTASTRHGVRVLAYPAEGPTVSTDRDAVDLIAQAFDHRPDLILLPIERLDEGFFTLSTRIAGEIVQKFVTYGIRLAIIGDITRQLEASSTLRDYVRETNRGSQVWFGATSTSSATLRARPEPGPYAERAGFEPARACALPGWTGSRRATTGTSPWVLLVLLVFLGAANSMAWRADTELMVA